MLPTHIDLRSMPSISKLTSTGERDIVGHQRGGISIPNVHTSQSRPAFLFPGSTVINIIGVMF